MPFAFSPTTTTFNGSFIFAALRRIAVCVRVSSLEFVREHQTGLQSFRSMRRIDARRRKASALRFRFSQSFASRRQRLSQAIVRSTIQRRGKHHKSFGVIGALDDFGFEIGEDFRQGLLEFRSLIAAVGKQLFQERIHPEQCRKKQNAAVAVLDIGRMNNRVQQQTERIYENMALLALDLFARIIAMRIDVGPPFSALFTLWLSMMAAVGLASRSPCSRHSTYRA